MENTKTITLQVNGKPKTFAPKINLPQFLEKMQFNPYLVVIEYNGEYHEVDSVSASEFFAGKNPSRDIGFNLGDRDEFGYSVSVVCETHVTRRNRLNIEEVRSGINKPNNIPRNL